MGRGRRSSGMGCSARPRSSPAGACGRGRRRPRSSPNGAVSRWSWSIRTTAPPSSGTRRRFTSRRWPPRWRTSPPASGTRC
ncbi:hypothetical protein E3O42_11765 [Cryobacterium adonitolivorans]|uniref:Uncharacterized protein n=1 Tax=Cryobacterium adonitolivorans TaxID=1259189 RepID=A0A4R8W299_9MICO|nr:hypothetical protein E3O42_11765 [Cryobacterium adonitolivorans]